MTSKKVPSTAFFSLLIMFGFALFGFESSAQSPKSLVSATSIEVKFSASEEKVTVIFIFENKTKKPMYITDDGSPEVQSVRFEPTDTCVLISKLQKPAAGQPEISVNATRVVPGKKYSHTLSWKIPFHHTGDLPKGWTKADKPICHNLRFEIAAIPGYDDLKPEAVGDSKKLFKLSPEARRHQETQTAESQGFEIPISLE